VISQELRDRKLPAVALASARCASNGARGNAPENMYAARPKVGG
jgi:hypothetical protein